MLFLEFFAKNRPIFFPLIVVFTIMMMSSIFVLDEDFKISFYSLAQQQIEKNPSFQDSYWTDKTVAAGNDSNKLEEKEVGPGEGIATLAVVLVNKAQSDISAIKGYLSLPDEFVSVGREINNNSSNTTFSNNNSNNLSNSMSIASYDSIVKPGQEFTLYFDIYIRNDAKVGLYYTNLDLVYSKVLTDGDITVKDIPISFRIPGKAVLDIDTDNQFLSPAKINNLGVNIINKGSAAANSAIVTISNNDENTEGGSLSTVSDSASTEFTGGDNSLESNNSTNATSLSSSTTTTNIDQPNDNLNASSSITTLGTLKYNVGNIKPGEIITINSLVYPATTAAGTLQNLDVQISYGNSIGNRETVNYNLGLVVNADPEESNFNVYLKNNNNNNLSLEQYYFNNRTVSDNMIITAGSIEDLIFVIKKSSYSSSDSDDIQDVVISLQPSSESVKVLGPSRWSFNTISEYTLLNTTLFASEELIGQPVQLNFNLDYLQDGTANSETLNLGLYVEGKIATRAYDFEINIIGDEPNLVFNLLNEGNTNAFFTTAEMIPPPSTNKTTDNMSTSGLDKNNNHSNTIASSSTLVEEYPPLQYLGDLAENSPLPVSIPLKIPNNTSSGSYPVFIKISYNDNLRNDHQIIVNGTVIHSSQIENSSNDSGLIFGLFSPVILGVLLLAMVIIIISFLIVRRFRKKKKYQKVESSTNDDDDGDGDTDDLDSVLNDKN